MSEEDSALLSPEMLAVLENATQEKPNEVVVEEKTVYCSRRCGHHELGSLKDLGKCDGGFDGEPCLALKKTICSKCMTFRDCPSCGCSRCDICLEDIDARCIFCQEALDNLGEVVEEESSEEDSEYESDEDYKPPPAPRSTEKRKAAIAAENKSPAKNAKK